MGEAQSGEMALSGRPAETPLRGWREIARFLGRDQSTARRWAADRGLPVFRGGARGLAVHAYASELEAWVRTETGRGGAMPPATPSAEAPPARPATRPPEIAAPGRRRILAGLCLGAGFCLGAATVLGVMAFSARPDARGMPDIPERARDLYVRGSFLRSRQTPDGAAEAIRLLRQAVEVHPPYGEAHAALAASYVLAHRCRTMSGWTALPRAERAARRAIELDPGLALARSVLAFIAFAWHRDVEASLSLFAEALGGDPRPAETLRWYAVTSILAGRAEAALSLAVRAQEVDPDSSAVRNLHARALFQCGRAAEAAAEAGEIVARDPGYPWSHETLAAVRLGAGDPAGYLESRGALAARIGDARESEAVAVGRAAFAAGGLAAMAEAMAAVAAAHHARGAALAFDVARPHAMAGRAAEALSWLEISFGRHEALLMTLRADPAFRPLYGDARFGALLSRLGLPAATG